MTVLRRLAVVVGVTVLVCAATFMTVELFGRSPVRRRRERDWADPRWAAVTSVVAPLAVIAAAAAILRVAAFFQLFDGLQIVVTGSLRGAGDTRTPMVCHLIGYWVIGLPLGAMLCFERGLGARGLWMGLSAGLIAIGLVLTAIWWSTARKWSRRLRTIGSV